MFMFEKATKLLHNQGKKILFSSFVAIVIIFLCYLVNNCPYPYWDTLNKYCWIDYLITNVASKKIDRSDAFFINISYDKQLADYSYSNGNLKGTVAITNRETLLKFLKIAEKTDKYKYIFLDIRFEKGINTVIDSELFSQINKMRDISCSAHSDIINSDKILSSKAIINDYFTTITSTNFTRYQFLQDGMPSVPLKIYLSLDRERNKPIKRWGLFYYSDGKLCQNSPFMTLPEDFWNLHDVEGNQNYYDLGPLLLTSYDEEDWSIQTNGKIIIVGDFMNDLHDTYAGMQPGSYLIYLAYKELQNGKHFVSWSFVIFTWILYVVMSMFIVNKKNVFNYIPYFQKKHSKTFLFVINLLGYSTILSLLSIIFYLIFY